MHARDRWTFRFLAALLLVSLVSAFAVEAYVHTDDGCAVEIHCLACRHAAGSTATFEVRVALPEAIAPVGRVVLAPESAVAQDAPSFRRSRAPPLA